MTCVVANDPSGPVEYKFFCRTDSRYDSTSISPQTNGWLPTNTYTTGIIGRRRQALEFYVIARDAYWNETQPSLSCHAWEPSLGPRIPGFFPGQHPLP